MTKNIKIESGIFNLKYFILFLFISSCGIMYASDYYWVGGTGEWSDINHWATTSGGGILHAQVPTVNDNVYFDANSFLSGNCTVTINSKNAICNDMDWTGAAFNPRLTGHDTTSLRIYGSLKFVTNLIQNYDGVVAFEATNTGKTISLSGKSFINNVYFQGNGGGWQFNDDFSTLKNIYFIHGKLSTNGHRLSCERFYSDNNHIRKLDISNSLIELDYWNIDGRNLDFNASSSDFILTDTLINFYGNNLTYNDISFTGPNGLLSNNNVYVIYNNIEFLAKGNIFGDCKIDSVIFYDQGFISENDSINYVLFEKNGSISGGNHVINKAIFQNKGIVEGNNEIDTLHFFQRAYVLGNNKIEELIIKLSGIIDGNNIIHQANLEGNDTLRGDNTFDILTFTPGNTYTFANNSTQTLNDEFNISANCYRPIRMLSDTNGLQANIVKVNGLVIGDYLSLRDLNAVGSSPFIANNSVDLGNNTNWTIETTNGIDLYWVKGSGDWNDPDHWDIISGGPGGHCPPNELDNTHFDQNSFVDSNSEVNINVSNAVCKDMSWEGVGWSTVLSGSYNNNLRIYGSLTFIEQMNVVYEGETFFEATELGQTITSANHEFRNNVWFNGRGGSWYLTDNFTSQNAILFQQGEIYTQANDISCDNFSSIDTTDRTLNLSTSTISLFGSGKIVWGISGKNLSLSADSSLIISNNSYGEIYNYNGNKFIYNIIEFYGIGSKLHNVTFSKYNLVSFFNYSGSIVGECTIDTASFYGKYGTIFGNDTIKAALFYEKGGKLNSSNHIIEIAVFHGDGEVSGSNTIDTALFFKNGKIIGKNTIDTTIIYNEAQISGENSIRTTTLFGDGKIYGDNIFGDLTFSKMRSYYLEKNHTQTIINNFSTVGSCTGPIIIHSNENTKFAGIDIITGTIEADYLILRDIHVYGNGVPYVAFNSVDLGNNSNWNIITSEPKELYWVDGTGNWTDSLHWAGTSGGSGGYCIPTPIDNVNFDSNSFINQNDTVKINIGNAMCHNMDWTDLELHPVFSGNETNNLRIFGSLYLTKNMFFSFNGPVFFESIETNNHIKSNGNSFHHDIFFQGINGEWILDDTLSCIYNISLIHGSLNTNEKPVICNAIWSNNSNHRDLDITSSTIIVNGSGMTTWILDGTNLDFSAQNSLIIFNSENAYLRNENGNSFKYNNIRFLKNSEINNTNAFTRYNLIEFNTNGEINGNCLIDSVIFNGSGSIYGSNKINYAHIWGSTGNLIGGNHEINTLIFENTGNISGNNSIDSLLILGKANISGNNNINYAILQDDGILKDYNSFNSLKFTPGNTYELEASKIQTVNEHFYIRGNNCFPITLRSQNEGFQAIISVPIDTVSGDFIEMRDIQATGGAKFYSGNYSTDISNNTGWDFTNSPGYIFGFPHDTTICSNDVTVIGTESFNTGKNTTYLWQDGSTGSNFTITNEDTLWLRINYADNCSYTDSIIIYRNPSPYIDLGGNRSMCFSDTIFIPIKSNNLSYLWNDGSTDSINFVSESGIYRVMVTANNGCKAADSIILVSIPNPYVFIGNDTTLNSNDQISLNAHNPGANYFWSNGDTSQIITVSGNQTIWVEVEKDGCFGYDTIFISEHPHCIIAVPSAFSPNGDNHNDVLYVRGDGFAEFELQIFNRLGEMMFQTNKSSNGWDGTYKGQKQEVDVYMYFLKGTCISGYQIVKKGSVTLLR
ncbi:MAG: gliding motility-associated C-terminal domain-containing protein [Bacteroidales bacterium]|nr:gliding motility-associated C-terminal domain-containing protein [Bacteroidales bacterium]